MAAAVSVLEDLVGALADDVIAREAREAFEGAVGEDVAAVLDVLGGDADRHVVEHRFQELRGRRQFSRQPALLGAVLMGRDRSAIGQLEILDQDRAAVGQFGDEPVGLGGAAVEILDADIEHAALAPQLQQFAAGHVARHVGARQPVDLEIAVVAEHDPPVRIGHHHALVEMVQRGADEGVAPQLRALGAAQRRNHPDRDRAEEGSDRRCRRSALPRSCWDRANRHSSQAQSHRERGTRGRERASAGDKAHDGRSRNQVLAACLPILASHQSPAHFQRRSVWLDGFGSGKRVPLQPQNVTQITAIALT